MSRDEAEFICPPFERVGIFVVCAGPYTPRMPDIRVGISGWTYPPWRGNFYPGGLPQKHELAYASRRFNALEINGTFYSLQRASSFGAWYEHTPPGFVFSMKGGKYITHQRRLKDIDGALANFFASGPLALREKLGPFVWQFPPNFRFDGVKFRAFFELLPRDTEELAKLARRHEAWMKDRAGVEADARRPVRHAVEFRHESFMDEEFFELAREHNVAVVIADAASEFPTTEEITADWVYVRLHGAREMYASGYTAEEIEAWARKIDAWRDGGEPADARRVAPPLARAKKAEGRDIYVFFDNTDVKQRAPVDARAMAERLGAGPAGTPEEVLQELGVKERSGGKPARADRGTGLADHNWGRAKTGKKKAARKDAAAKPRAPKTKKKAPRKK